MMSSIKLVVFDMAGTTVRDNREVESCFSKSLEEAGLQIPEERILAVQGWSKYFVFETLWDEKLGRDHPEYRERVNANYVLFKEILEEHYLSNPAEQQPYTQEVFEWLKSRGVKIALTTGFYREVTNIILKQLGWAKNLGDKPTSNGRSIIDLSLCSDDVKTGRPAPDMILLAMKELSVQDPFEVMKVGDTPSDLKAGKKAGVALNIGVLNGTHNSEQLKGFEHDYLIDDLRGVRRLINYVGYN